MGQSYSLTQIEVAVHTSAIMLGKLTELPRRMGSLDRSYILSLSADSAVTRMQRRLALLQMRCRWGTQCPQSAT